MLDWNEEQPIYCQLRDRVMGLILDGSYAEGDALPSVRTVASDYQINHLTVSKSYQILVDMGIVEKKRGLGMFVLAGARELILKEEREKFYQQELPQLAKRIVQLGIDSEELLNKLTDLSKD